MVRWPAVLRGSALRASHLRMTAGPRTTRGRLMMTAGSSSRLVHRPEHLDDRGLGREDGHKLALHPLQQHRVAVVVLTLRVEFHVLPRHDGLVARDIGGGE